MVCPDGALVQEFVAGRLDGGAVAQFEAHIETCGECFLRLAAAAAEASVQARGAFPPATRSGSRLEQCLAATERADTPLEWPELGAPEARKKVGPYLVTGLLGVGGMGVVYRARHDVSGKDVALKTVKVPLQASATAMLRQEIEFLRQAQHPSIVALVDADLLADEPWYAMELVAGATLMEFNHRLWPRRDGNDPDGNVPAAGGRLAETLRLFACLCEPVDFIHRSGLVHGDLKPSNVFLRSDSDPVLLDFGLASRARGSVGREALFVTGRLRGSLPYIAPEIIRGHIPDTRADLYALGCMLYESLVGSPPFVSASGIAIIDRHLHQAPTPASQRVVGVPSELDALLLRLLAKSPHERFGHASSLGQSLRALVRAMAPGLAGTEVYAAASPTTLFRPPMVGRDSDLSNVLQSFDAALASGSGSMLLISGESGIGKTFFTTEVAQRATLAGFRVVTGECVPLDVTTMTPADAGTRPLQGFRHLFEGLRERCQEHGAEEIGLLFGDRLPVLSQSLPVLRHLSNGAVALDPPPTLPASAARERIVTAVADTIAAYVARGGPLLLAVDDLQWADDLTLAVLEHLDEAFFAQLPLIVMANFRSDEAGEAVQRLTRKPWIRELRLSRLRGAQIRALVGGMLSMSAPPEALVGYIDAHAEGIPFFAAEYLRGLVAAGALVYDLGTWSTHTPKLDEFRAPGRSQLPRTLQDLIRGRLQRLSGETLELLEAGSVLGRRFSVSLLNRMTSIAEWRPLLEAAAAIQVTTSEDADTYTFLHDKIRETLYSGLSEQRKTELHLVAARAIEQSGSAPDEYGVIAHHFRQGGEALRALDYLERAGAHALTVAANADADRFFGEALELEATLVKRQPSVRRARWLRQRGDALSGLGRMIDSAAALKASAALLGRPFPSNKPAMAAKLAREVATQVWHRLRRSSEPAPGRERAEVNSEVMRVFERLHEVSYYLGRDADLVLSTTVSLNASERIGPTPSLAIAYSNAAMLAGVMPMRRLANHYFRLASSAVRVAPDPCAESWVLEMEGSYRVWQGERQQAFDSLTRAIRLSLDGGFFRRCDEAECALIGLDLVAGFHDLALARVERVSPSARKRNDLQIQGWLLLDRAEVCLLRGCTDDALAQLERAQPLLGALGRPERIWATAVEACVQHRRGERELARGCTDRALSLIAAGQPVHSSCLNAYDHLAEVAVDIFRSEHGSDARRENLSRAHQACSILERVANVFPISRPAAVLHRGLLDVVRLPRSVPTVVGRWQRAVALAQRLTVPYPELRLHRALLAHLSTEARHAREHADRLATLSVDLQLDQQHASPPVCQAQPAA